MLPPLPGGLLAIEAATIGVTHPAHMADEIVYNLDVLLLLVFMVAGIYFMKQLLLFYEAVATISFYQTVAQYPLKDATFAGLLCRNSVAFRLLGCVDSNRSGDQRCHWLLFYLSQRETSNQADSDGNISDVSGFSSNERKQTLEQFRAFFRSLLIQAGVGTALGGVMTMVGEPQT